MGKCFLHGNGGTVIERKTGTINTSTGTFTENTGFKPDLVVITNLGGATGEFSVAGVFSAPFAENTGGAVSCSGVDAANSAVVGIEFAQSDSGFSGSVYAMSEEGNGLLQYAITMKYTAVKYT